MPHRPCLRLFFNKPCLQIGSMLVSDRVRVCDTGTGGIYSPYIGCSNCATTTRVPAVPCKAITICWG